MDDLGQEDAVVVDIMAAIDEWSDEYGLRPEVRRTERWEFASYWMSLLIVAAFVGPFMLLAVVANWAHVPFFEAAQTSAGYVLLTAFAMLGVPLTMLVRGPKPRLRRRLALADLENGRPVDRRHHVF